MGGGLRALPGEEAEAEGQQYVRAFKITTWNQQAATRPVGEIARKKVRPFSALDCIPEPVGISACCGISRSISLLALHCNRKRLVPWPHIIVCWRVHL